MNIFKNKLIIFALAVSIGFFVGSYYNSQNDIPLGLAIPQTVALFETSLQAPISSSATTLILTANSIRGGGALSGFTCLTVDEGSNNAEQICGTVSGTSMTSLQRGISYVNGTTTVSANQFSHRRGANVKQTDSPIIQRLKAQNAGQDTFINKLIYATDLTFTDNKHIISKKYADDLAIAGSPDATLTVKGIVEIASQIGMASTSPAGSGDTTATLALSATFSTSTPDGTSQAGLFAVISKNNGKLHQLWLDLTESFTWTGLHIFTETTTMTTNIVDSIIVNGFYPLLSNATTTSGIVTINATTTLSSDVYYDTLTVDAGAGIITNGYRIFVKNTLTNNGVIQNNGGDGGNAPSSVPGTGGKGTHTGTLIGTEDGDAGRGGANDTNAHVCGASQFTATSSIGVAGANGGKGGNSGSTGCVGGSITISRNTLTNVYEALSFTDLASTSQSWLRFVQLPLSGSATSGGGAGGGCAGCGGDGGGGGAGASGGIIWILAKNILNIGTIQSTGGDGGNGDDALDAGGGGAGGAGGVIVLIYNTLTNTGDINTPGGTGGTPGSGGVPTSGTNGNTGKIYHIRMD